MFIKFELSKNKYSKLNFTILYFAQYKFIYIFVSSFTIYSESIIHNCSFESWSNNTNRTLKL